MFSIFKYIVFFFKAKHVKSLKTFDEKLFVVFERSKKIYISKIEDKRHELRNNKQKISVSDLGVGSKRQKGSIRRISNIAKTSLTTRKIANLFYSIIHHNRSNNILEFGTSLGITAAYFCVANSNAVVISIEGSKAIINEAKKIKSDLNLKNLQLINSNFDFVLMNMLGNYESFDFVHIDGNHSYKATMKYFSHLLKIANENTIFAIADIYWSADMLKAWKEIIKQNKVRLNIDLYFVGLVFLTEKYEKRSMKIRL